MLPKEDRKALLLRLYNEDVPLHDSSKDRFKNNPVKVGEIDLDDVESVDDEDGGVSLAVVDTAATNTSAADPQLQDVEMDGAAT